MLAAILAFFRTSPDAPSLAGSPASRPRYRRWRSSVFWSVTLGYGPSTRGSTFGRQEAHARRGRAQRDRDGMIGSALLMVYSVGSSSTAPGRRANIARFMSTALLCSAAISLVSTSTVFAVFSALGPQRLGPVDRVGAERGLSHLAGRNAHSIWSASHSIGEGLTFAGTATLVSVLGWQWGFWGPGIVCLLASLVLYHTIADRPQTLGLPSIADYTNEPEPEAGGSIGAFQKQVLLHPGVWMLAAANAFLSVARYGMANWGPLYLSVAKDYSGVAAGSVLAIYPLAEIAGSITSGFVSDRFFKSRRNAPALSTPARDRVAAGALRDSPRLPVARRDRPRGVRLRARRVAGVPRRADGDRPRVAQGGGRGHGPGRPAHLHRGRGAGHAERRADRPIEGGRRRRDDLLVRAGVHGVDRRAGTLDAVRGVTVDLLAAAEGDARQ
jgi:OPA family sugar phosphate sensor protein UhpC-like MFS transporter